MKIGNWKLKIKTTVPVVAIIAFAVILRLLPHPANFAPIAALALFGGVYLDKKYAFIIPLVAMFIADIFLGFHNTMVFVYGSFLLTGLIGLWVKSHKSFATIAGAALTSSLLFFIITNFGVWFMGNMYPKTVSGLFACYSAAIPFFRNTVLGDLFYTGIFFGSYELALRFANSKLQILKSK